jgi:PAS domain S-box-containing protein
MDISLPGKCSGIDAAQVIRDTYSIPVIFLTAHSDGPTFEKAIQAEPFGFIIKPYASVNIRTSIEMALFKNVLEKKLRESERTVRALLNATLDALALLDCEKKTVAINEAMRQILEKRPEDLAGISLAGIIASGQFSFNEEMVEEIFRSGKSFHSKDEWNGKWFDTTVFPVREPDGTISRIAIQSHDVTWLKQMEDELKSIGIEQIEHNMEQFQILNDEIRTPLQVIMFYLSMGKCEYRTQIEERIKIIDSLVTRLDKGWLESEKVYSFLLRHYPPGSYPNGSLPAITGRQS